MLVWLGGRVRPADSGRDAREATVLLLASLAPGRFKCRISNGDCAALIAISVCCQWVAGCMAAGISVMAMVVHFISSAPRAAAATVRRRAPVRSSNEPHSLEHTLLLQPQS